MSAQVFTASELTTPTIAIFIFSVVVFFAVTKSVVGSFIAGAVKAAVFFVVFTYFFSGQVTGYDDLYYLETGKKYAELEVKASDMLFDPVKLVDAAESSHVLYPLFNYYSIRLFGEHYFAPVTLNVMLATLVAVLGARLAAFEFRLTRTQKKLLFCLFFLHPEILGWSSVFNGKEMCVLLCHVLLLIGVSLIFRKRWVTAVLVIVPVVFLLSGLRYYVPFLFAAAFLGYAILTLRNWRGLLLLVIGGCTMGLIVMQLYGGFQYGLEFMLSTLSDPLFGVLHFLMTPRPFHLEQEYSFLLIPSIYHWCVFPFAVFGFWYVWKMRAPFSRFMIIYFLTFVAFYSTFEGLQGARHRLQLAFAFGIFEFFGLYGGLRAISTSSRKARRQAAIRVVPSASQCAAGLKPGYTSEI